MESDVEKPGTCIIEDVSLEREHDVARTTSSVVENQQEEVKTSSSWMFCKSGSAEDPCDVARAVLEELLRCTVLKTETNANEAVAVIEKAKMEAVVVNSAKNDYSAISGIVTDTCQHETFQQLLGLEEDSENNALVEAILAKLNNPGAKLNRRERRALQRELETAQGIQRSYSAAQQTTASNSFIGQRIVKGENRSSKDGTTQKRSCATLCASDEIPKEKRKLKDVHLIALVNRESAFKFDNVAMLPHHSVSDAFRCARMSYASNSFPINNFLKLCRFSTNGSLVGTTSADNSARIFGLNEEQHLTLLTRIPLGDPIYDATWLPCGTNSQLLATTAKHHPIHLWGEHGSRFSSYRGINHLDELTAAYSVAFSNDGAQLYGGYDSCIRIWDTSRPGRQHTSIKTWEKHNGGQKSIVSCIVMNKSFAGVYAVATYDGSIGFYSDRTNSLECMFSTDFSAITDMHYSHDGQRLFVAPRKSNEMLCYDMRVPGTLVFKMLRPFATNQRVCFDLDSASRYLFSGTSDGQLVVFDLNDNAVEKLPIFVRKVADCSVPCVSVNDTKVPLLVLATGERVFPTPQLPASSESASESSDSDEEKHCYRRRRLESELNNSLQLWTF